MGKRLLGRDTSDRPKDGAGLGRGSPEPRWDCLTKISDGLKGRSGVKIAGYKSLSQAQSGQTLARFLCPAWAEGHREERGLSANAEVDPEVAAAGGCPPELTTSLP